MAVKTAPEDALDGHGVVATKGKNTIHLFLFLVPVFLPFSAEFHGAIGFPEDNIATFGSLKDMSILIVYGNGESLVPHNYLWLEDVKYLVPLEINEIDLGVRCQDYADVQLVEIVVIACQNSLQRFDI
jgi:hypothetical protein